MTQAFDPYHKWLGIPPEEQPPHHYRLLGIKPFEADPDVIQSAADRQMVHLRSFQTGKNAQSSQRLLNEVAAAKICLLNPDKKAAYDERLQGELPKSLRAAESLPAQDTFDAGLADLIEKEAVHSRSRVSSQAGPRVQGAKQFPTRRVAIVGAAVAGVLLVLGLVVWGVTGGEKPTVAARVETIPAADRPPAEPARPATPNQFDTKNSGASPSEPVPAAFTDPGTEPVKPAAEQPPSSEPAPPSNGGDNPADAVPAKPSQEGGPSEEKPKEAPAEARAEKQRLPAPSDAAQAEAMKLARELYKDEYAKTKTAEEKQALAKKILEKAEEAGNDAAGAFVLFRLARDTAVQAGNGQAAFEAIEGMAERYAVDAVEMKSDVLAGFAKKARAPADHASLAEQLLNVIDDAVAEDKLAQAGELGKLALTEATKARDKELLVTTRARLKEVQQAAKTFAEFEAAKAALAEKPDDPEANLAAGAYLCFVKGDWEKGLPHLAKGSDAELKALAGREVSSPPTESAQQVKLADLWWDLAQPAKGKKKDALLLHAGTWYEQAKEKLTGLSKTKVEKRLEEIAKVEEGSPAGERSKAAGGRGRNAINFGKARTVYLDDLQPIDFKVGSDGQLGKHGNGPDGIRCIVRGVVPAHSLCTHPPINGAAYAAYQLGGQFRAFKATATLGNTSATPLTFKVLGDGQLLWRSRPLKTPADSAECDIRVSKIKTLILQVDCPGPNGSAWALWVDPVLVK